MLSSGTTDILRALVAIPSHHGNPESLHQIVDLVAEYFPGDFSRRKYVSGEKPSLIISNRDTNEFDVILTAHLDIAFDHKDSYVLTEKENRLYGNAVVDMKAACAVMMQWMKDHALSSKLKIGMVFTTDEEIGGEHGTKYLLEQDNLRTKLVILPDGGYGHEITIAQKGIFFVQLRAEGKASRSINPWRGVNALDMLIDGYTSIRSLFSTDLSDENNWHPTLTLKKISNTNDDPYLDGVITRAEALLEVSYTDSRSKQEWIELMKRIAPQLEIREDPIFDIAFYGTSPRDPFITLFNESVQRVTGAPWPFRKENGASDARFYQQFNIPVLMFKLMGDNSHLPDEWISLDTMDIVAKILADFMSKLENHKDIA